jgi:hypothetical protein
LNRLRVLLPLPCAQTIVLSHGGCSELQARQRLLTSHNAPRNR